MAVMSIVTDLYKYLIIFTLNIYNEPALRGDQPMKTDSPCVNTVTQYSYF